MCLTQAATVAELRRVPWLALILGPTWPTRDFPLWALSSRSLGPTLNRLTYWLAFRLLWAAEKPHIAPWRASLGLRPLPPGSQSPAALGASRTPVLVACSRLWCGPGQARPTDYPPDVSLTGFLLPPAEAEPLDPALAVFVAGSGGAPRGRLPLVCLGFGSMAAPDPSALASLAASALRLVPARGVLLAGWSTSPLASAASPELAAALADGTLFCAAAAPHAALLPLCDCVVHHGGVGTCAAGLAAGLPCVPCPCMVDQPHNASLLVRLGVAPRALPLAGLTAAALAAAMREAIGEPRYRQAAERCAAVVAAEVTAGEPLMIAAVEGARSRWS